MLCDFLLVIGSHVQNMPRALVHDSLPVDGLKKVARQLFLNAAAQAGLFLVIPWMFCRGIAKAKNLVEIFSGKIRSRKSAGPFEALAIAN